MSRLAGCGVVSLTGVGVALPALDSLLSGPPVAGVVLAAFTAVVGLALVGAGVALYRSGVSTPNALRVAGWNTLGVVVLAAVMVLVLAYQTAVGGAVSSPLLVGAAVVGVSAVAHVLIGVNDVRRIRARELAAERERLSVINRLVRHNLRTEAQLLLGLADDAGAEVADSIRETGRRLGEMNDDIKHLQRLVGGDRAAGTVELAALAEAAAEDARERFPGADITVDVPDIAVAADDRLRLVVDELVENAVEHGGQRVRVAATVEDRHVALRVADDGPGIPDAEWAVVAGEREITQTEHASGLGLWLVKWLVESYGGGVAREESDLGGSAVVVRLDRA
ncbi:MAG: sensor histidine kinase [Halobacteriaceae archaeon]